MKGKERMAQQGYLDLIKQGVTIWNAWRQQHPSTIPDLSKADLNGANLSRADLSRADLHEANLSRANLSDANLRFSDLSRADLSRANLIGANLCQTGLIGADFSRAIAEYTVFGDIDLRLVKGLETIRHLGPSTIGTDTLSRSQGNIPEVFLRGAGLSDRFIDYARSLTQNPFEYYTCFISYSSKDQEFAERLYADLQSKNVRCWYAPEDLKIGDKFRTRIDESIRVHDKLLLVLSEHSVISPWVEKEVETALEKEHQQRKLVLFPVKLDETVMQTSQAWAADIRRMRHIGDFTRWKEHDAYQRGLQRLLRDLKTESTKHGR